MYFTVELTGGSPQYTFTCISTGRPVYNVLWYIRYYDYYDYYYYYRYYDYYVIGGEAVLNDSMTAQYISTLTVTELQVYYECDVYTFQFAAYSAVNTEGN